MEVVDAHPSHQEHVFVTVNALLAALFLVLLLVIGGSVNAVTALFLVLLLVIRGSVDALIAAVISSLRCPRSMLWKSSTPITP